MGANGTLARELQAQKPAQHAMTALTHTELDICDSTAVRVAVKSAEPEWVINASAYNNVDAAETNPDIAFAVNARAVGDLARICRENGCGLVHFGTDFVFDGTASGFYSEDDAVRPVNVYGKSKAEGEQLVRKSGVSHLIIRTSWLYGRGGKSFLSTIWQRATNRTPTRVVDDQFSCCTYAGDLAGITWQCFGRLEGTYHVANRGRVNRFMIAQRVFDAVGASDIVSPCSTVEFPAVATRPTNSAMSVTKVERALGYALPEWTDALDRHLAELRRTG